MEVVTSVYAKKYDQNSPNWQREQDYNLVFFRAQEQWFNDVLRAKGHLFLNEVYDALGLSRTRAGAICGWWYAGQKEVDVTMDIVGPDKDGAYVLDFNVEGVIWDRLPD